MVGRMWTVAPSLLLLLSQTLASAVTTKHAATTKSPAPKRHRAQARQAVTRVSRRGEKKPCGKLMCSKKDVWEGEGLWDMPYEWTYVVDVAAKELTDSDYTEYSCILDTGSSDTAIECSLSYDSDVCISETYGDGSYWLGYESSTIDAGFVSDSSSIIAETTLDVITASSEGDESFFSGGYTGILGLGYAGLASDYSDCTSGRTVGSSTPLVDALYSAGQLDSNIFQLSYCGDTAPFVIGEVDYSDVSGDIQYTDTQKTLGIDYAYYLVEITSFDVGDAGLDIDASSFNTYGGTLVDSGTTFLYLPTDVYSTFVTYLKDTYTWLTDDFFNDYACIDSTVISELPSLTFGFSDFSIELPASSYLAEWDGCYYWAVSYSSLSILGSLAMQGFTVVFDRDENRIGFAEASCTVEWDDDFSVDAATSSSATGKQATKAAAATTSATTKPTKASQTVDVKQSRRAKGQTAGKRMRKTTSKPRRSRHSAKGHAVLRPGKVPDSSKSRQRADLAVVKRGGKMSTSRGPERFLKRLEKLKQSATTSLNAQSPQAPPQGFAVMHAVILAFGMLAVGALVAAVKRREDAREGYQRVAEYEM